MEPGQSQLSATGRHYSNIRIVALAMLVAFALGIAATWAFARSDAGGGLFTLRREAPAGIAGATGAPRDISLAGPLPSPSASASAAAAQVERVVEQQGGLDARLAAMEQRLTRLDIASQSAAGNAARAEALLIAFASRRVIERGEPLGYLADQLRLRFGEDRPNAVQTIIDAAADPVTLDQLLARFEGLAPRLDNAPDSEGLVPMLQRELSELFIVRRETTASPVAERRLERARDFLETGRIEPAIAEVRRLPGAPSAGDWIDDAERYARAQRALETLETVAIADTRELRDGEGSAVEQRSPAGNARQ